MKKTNPFFKGSAFIFAFSVFILASSINLRAQVSSFYTFSQSVGTYTAISGGTVIANAASLNMDDNVFGPITMPAFSFDGVTYTSVYISTNGHITFGGAPTATNYLPLSGTEGYAACIAAFGEDLDAATSGTRNIRYQTVGTEFIIQWQNVARYSTNDRISFQIRLNNANNQIKIVYGGTITPDADTFYPEVGLRGPDNTFPTNINNRKVVAGTGAWVNSTAGTANTSSCYFNSATPGTVPAVGTTFIWTASPTDIRAGGFVAPGTSGCYTANQTVSVSIQNTGGTAINFATTPVTVNCSVTGPNPTSFAPVIVNTGTLAVNASQTVTISTTYNMLTAGTYNFTATTAVTGDGNASNNTTTITRDGHNPIVTIPPTTNICTGGNTSLSANATVYNYNSSFTNNTPLAIPDDVPAGVNSSIIVSGVPGLASGISSALIQNISHTFDGDLILKLTAPNGSFVLLSNQEGGGGANFVQTLFTGSAITPISAGAAPFTGSFLPENPLSGLTGPANGTWVLNVSDNAAADVGILNGWTLTFPVANSISSYSWTPSTGLSATNVANPTANPTSTSTYTVTVTDISGCTATSSVTVTVNPLPTVTANTTSASICTGSNVTLTGGGATTYTWDNGVTDGIAFSPASTNIYTTTGTDANGCSNTATVSVTVNALPTVVANASATTICQGNNVTLTGSGATSYTWDNSVTNGVAFSPASTNIYTTTGTDGNGCTNTATVGVTVNTLPAVTANATSTSICPGDNVTLSGGGAISYSWDNSVTDGVAFAPAGTNLYTVTGTDGNSCSNTATVTVTVAPTPTVSANASASSVCPGNNVTLSGGGAASYSWDNGVSDGVAFAPASTNTYTVIGFTGSCSDTAMVTVTVNSVPNVQANTTATTVCQGNNVTLTGSGATSYTWDNGVTDGLAFSPASTNTYTTTGTDANGCTNTATVSVTVNALPLVGANATTTMICAGSNVTFTGSGATSYTWDNGVTDGVAFFPSSTNTYTTTGTDGNGCTNTATVSVTVNTLPAVTANATSTTVCPGGNVTLTGGGASSYTWDNSVTNGVAFVPAGTNMYTVTGTDLNNCSNTATITVSVSSTLNVTANATDNNICTGDNIILTGGGATSYTWDNGVVDGISFVPGGTNTFTVIGMTGSCSDTAMITITVNSLPSVTASATDNNLCAGEFTTLNGGGASSYTWTGGATNAVPFAPGATNTYTVTGTDVNNCSNTSTVTVAVNALPIVSLNLTTDTVCVTGSLVSLSGGIPSGGNFSGTGVSAGNFDPAIGVGSYTITYSFTDANNCSNMDTQNMQVIGCLGIETADIFSMHIYPNPNEGNFFISLNELPGNTAVNIYNSIGQKVYSNRMQSSLEEISLDLRAGMYVVELTNGKDYVRKQVVVK
jgi:subtilisin-like proprotein convertase family protein